MAGSACGVDGRVNAVLLPPVDVRGTLNACPELLAAHQLLQCTPSDDAFPRLIPRAFALFFQRTRTFRWGCREKPIVIKTESSSASTASVTTAFLNGTTTPPSFAYYNTTPAGILVHEDWTKQETDLIDDLVQFRCAPGQYNELASLLYNPSETSMKLLFHFRELGNGQLSEAGLSQAADLLLLHSRVRHAGAVRCAGAHIESVLICGRVAPISPAGHLLGRVAADLLLGLHRDGGCDLRGRDPLGALRAVAALWRGVWSAVWPVLFSRAASMRKPQT